MTKISRIILPLGWVWNEGYAILVDPDREVVIPPDVAFPAAPTSGKLLVEYDDGRMEIVRPECSEAAPHGSLANAVREARGGDAPTAFKGYA